MSFEAVNPVYPQEESHNHSNNVSSEFMQQPVPTSQSDQVESELRPVEDVPPPTETDDQEKEQSSKEGGKGPRQLSVSVVKLGAKL